jgi:multidrug efflux pump subunit AcrB
MFHGDEIPLFSVNVTMPTGTRLETTDAVMRQFEEIALALPKSEVKAVITKTGGIWTETASRLDSHLGSLQVELVRAKYRDQTIDEIVAEFRQKVNRITGPEQIEFQKMESGPPTGADVEVMVTGKHFSELEAISGELKGELSKISGVTDINDNYSLGRLSKMWKI